MSECCMSFVYLLLLLFSVEARGTPAQEQCKSSGCVKHCSCVYYKPRHCQEILENGCDDDGVYRIFPKGYRRGLEVYCDQTTDGGGWQVLQRRFNGTLDFSRKWLDYKFGFGDITGEFWLGNEHVYHILNQKGINAALRLDLEDTVNNTLFAEYMTFVCRAMPTPTKSIWETYTEIVVGNIMHLFKNHQLFSTIDRDHDGTHGSYKMGEVGWWFSPSHGGRPRGVLNGKSTPKNYKGNWITWIDVNLYLRRTEMKFR